jgi:hypothetical protein
MTDPKLRADFLDMKLRWMLLARSYSFVESLQDFLIPIEKPTRTPTQRAGGLIVTQQPMIRFSLQASA